MRRPRSAQSFTLVELMLAALLGTFLCGVVFQLVFAETRQGGAFAQSLCSSNGNGARWGC